MISFIPALAFAVYAATVSQPIQAVPGTRSAIAPMNTILGPTGLIKVPTAYVTPVRTAHVSASFGENVRGPAVNYGLLQYIEVGATYLDRDNQSNKAIANGKLELIPQNFNWLEVGIGVIDVADAVERSFYVVGSVDLRVPRAVDDRAIGLRIHGGVGTGMFHDRLLAGAELVLDPRFDLIGEYDSENFNAALRYSPNEFVRIQAGFTKDNLFFGLGGAIQF